MKTANPILLIALILLSGVAVVASRPSRNTAPRGGQAGPPGPLQSFLTTIHGARKYLAAAGVARSVSIFGMYPVETIKVRK